MAKSEEESVREEFYFALSNRIRTDTLKRKLHHAIVWLNATEIQTAVNEYINFYYYE
ncbi:MAG: hypothetical protein LBQ04_02015 [Endomicrobium sp.]|jgi:hypothetical protein|nr:hypothetical protein [Endomicrobium sp.]